MNFLLLLLRSGIEKNGNQLPTLDPALSHKSTSDTRSNKQKTIYMEIY